LGSEDDSLAFAKEIKKIIGSEEETEW